MINSNTNYQIIKVESFPFKEKKRSFAEHDLGWDGEETSPYPIDQESGRFANAQLPILLAHNSALRRLPDLNCGVALQERVSLLSSPEGNPTFNRPREKKKFSF